jgi:hypothetical protein
MVGITPASCIPGCMASLLESRNEGYLHSNRNNNYKKEKMIRTNIFT